MGWWYFEPKPKPREAVGGIKAQTRGGKFAASWWGQRWLEVLESFQIGGRLARGRSYARRGQVLSIDIRKGKVKADVQGSRPEPYRVVIELNPLAKSDWSAVSEALASEALFAARLLAGEMPAEIEKVFADAGTALFPTALVDLKTDCSCPDWSNPCKHVAAVYYLLGEEFDRDPFLIFQLRGMTRDELFAKLNATPRAATNRETSELPEPLPTDADAFWSMGVLPPDAAGDATPAPMTAACLKRLGNLPFWRGAAPMLEVLEPIYRVARERGVRNYLGNAENSDPPAIPNSLPRKGRQRSVKH